MTTNPARVSVLTAFSLAVALSLGSGTAGAAGVPSQLLFDHTGTACHSVTGHNLSTNPKMSQTGIAFVNGQLLISCWGDTTITTISPTDGHEISVATIAAGSYKAFGALAYDSITGTLWACASTNNAGTGSPENTMSEVGTINLTLRTFSPVFNSPGCDNGLAWDPGSAPGRAGTLWTSGDIDTVLYNYSKTGVQRSHVDVKTLMGTKPGNSGIAIGGGDFYLANPQGTTKAVYSVLPDFSGYADPSEPRLSSAHRYEDLECDDQTYAPQTVIWVMWFNQNILTPLPISGTCTAGSPPPPELSVSQSSNSPVTAGQTLNFTDTVSNAGPGTETNVSLSEAMPSNAGFASATPSTGTCTPGTPLTCSLGTLLPGATATVTVSFTTFGPGTVDSPVSVSSDESSQVSDDKPATVNPAPGVTYVTVADAGISPAAAAQTLGGSVRFLIQGSAQHSIADNSGLGLFASGSLSPPAAYDFAFPASGIYSVIDSTTGSTATVQLQTGNPSTASVGVGFSVPWATQPLPTGLVEDVQVLLPGTTTWQNVAHGTTAQSATYTAASAGTYKFRARIRNATTGTATPYSSGHATTVS
ncbi:MAG: DUF11 domain-containing protein [Gaiellales bacterium]